MHVQKQSGNVLKPNCSDPTSTIRCILLYQTNNKPKYATSICTPSGIQDKQKTMQTSPPKHLGESDVTHSHSNKSVAGYN